MMMRLRHQAASMAVASGTQCFIAQALSTIAKRILTMAWPGELNGAEVPDQKLLHACFHCVPFANEGAYFSRGPKRLDLSIALFQWALARSAAHPPLAF